jgi:hypothetical protein
MLTIQAFQAAAGTPATKAPGTMEAHSPECSAKDACPVLA